MDETVNSNLKPPRGYDDPSTKIWSLYLNHAEKDIERVTESFKGDMDAILVFAGLFSACVTTFLVESYRNLVPDNTDTTVILLAQIYHQLSNGTALPNTVPSVNQAIDPNAFVPSTSSLACNILWFLSLSLSLTAALSATLVQQWTRSYLQATVGRDLPYQRARISAYLYEGLERFHMRGMVSAIPMLLHVSLLLFFAGLVEFLRPVNPGISYLIFGLLLLSAVLYILITFLPVFYFDCPYASPLTNIWWRILRSINLIRRRNSQGTYSPVPLNSSLTQVREWEATDISYDRDERDFRAICWTLEHSLDDSILEQFAQVIPDIVTGFDYSAKLLCHRLLDHEDASMRLNFRLGRLLASCTVDSPLTKKRSMSALSAIWSLTMMSLPIKTTDSTRQWLPQDALRFDEETLRVIEIAQRSIPEAAPYCVSTAAAVARSLLDVAGDHLLLLEADLLNYTRTGSLPEPYQKLVLKASQNVLPQRDPRSMIERIDKEVWDVEQNLMQEKPPSMLMPMVHISSGSLLRHLKDLVPVILKEEDSLHSGYVGEVLERLDNLQLLFGQAGLLLILDFIGYVLRNASLPYEFFNTMRRLYLKLNLDNRHNAPFSLSSQNRLVRYLDNALSSDNSDWNQSPPRLSEGVVSMLLGLSRGLTDPECIFKAKGVVLTYTKVCTSPQTLDAAHEALIEMALPDCTRPKETLDIFSEHVYSNMKLASTSTSRNGPLSD